MQTPTWRELVGPERLDPYGGPFNGQEARAALFVELREKTQPVALVETGSYRGSTTELFGQTGLPTYSVELNEMEARFTAVRVKRMPNVQVRQGDSPSVLREWLAGPLQELHEQGQRSVFFYLDAHWEETLPLREEVRVIFAHCPRAVVMVDDFMVEGDKGYGFDDYGEGKRLEAAYLEEVRQEFGLTLFYPATPAEKETGCRTGCVVLAGPAMRPLLEEVKLLREAK